MDGKVMMRRRSAASRGFRAHGGWTTVRRMMPVMVSTRFDNCAGRYSDSKMVNKLRRAGG